ncbi:DUF6531 domain-containing protein [Streptomyces sp. NPDC049881]|uniref:DUF6531 domain-containing protein n=1 Tax=Streptomyces sp. NPDC049881 TaxID=3155778 RepID=UPI0034351981
MDSDPTPGDPEEVRLLADELQTFSDDVAEALGKVRGLASDRAVQDWAGLSAEAFRSEFDGVPGNLEKLRDSYDLCAQALGTYWPKLQAAQGQADRALERAVAAQADLTSAQGALGDAQGWVSRAGEEAERLQREGERAGAPAPDEGEVRAATRDRQAADQARESAQARVDTAQDSLDAARELARQAREMREEAAREAARDIDEASDAGIQNRKWWQKAVHWVTENWDTIVDVCKVIVAVLGVVVMIIGGPLAWVVLAAALVVLADTLVKYANGEASLWDVAFAALDCIPGMKGLTTLGGLARGLRGGLAAARTGLRGIAQGVRGLATRGRAMLSNGAQALQSRFRSILRTTGSDPVDMATGRMFLPQTDLTLPGTLPFAFTRRVDSGYRAGRWFGPTWSSTVDERLETDREGVVFLAEDGMLLAYPHPPQSGAPVLPEVGPRRPLARTPDGGCTLTDPATGLVRHFPPPDRTGTAWLVRLSDRNGNHADFDRDGDGAPTAIRHSGGYHLALTTDQGRVTALDLLHADGTRTAVRRYHYTDGDLTEVHGPTGRLLSLAYDHRLRVTSWTDSNGRRYDYAYDARDRCVSEGGEAGHIAVTLAYDGTDPAWPGHRVTTLTTAAGDVTRFVVNDAYQVVAEIDPLGHTTRTRYDAHHHVTAWTDALGRTTRVTLDPAGRPVEVTYPDGAVSRSVWDGATRTATAVLPGGSWLREFDERGNCVAVTDPSGATTRYAYDARGALAAVTDPLGATTRLRCDAAGLPVLITDPLGHSTTRRYDAFGRVAEYADALGATVAVRWTADGHPAARRGPDGATEAWEYDGEGNCVRHTAPDGGVTAFEYGHFDLLTARTDPDGARHTFTHDASLRLTSVTGPRGRAWEYTYDAAGRLAAERDFDGRTTTYRRDAADRLVARTNAAGQTVTFAYDELGRLTGKTLDGVAYAFEHFRGGGMARVTGPGLTMAWERDALGRVRSETVNGRTLSFRHDAAGRRVSRRTPSGVVSSYDWDAAGRRVRLNAAGHTVAFDHDPVGRETGRRVDGALSLARAWDPAGRPTDLAVTSGGDPLQRLGWAYGPGGGLAGLRDALRGDTRLTHDAAGRVTDVRGRDSVESYAYDPAGNQTHASWSGHRPGVESQGDRTYRGTGLRRAGAVHYEYDKAGRITLRRRTRLSRKPDVWRYAWDAEDRLVALTTPDGTVWRYLYDPFGRRTAKQRLAADGVTVAEETAFTWDGTTLVEQTTSGPGMARPVSLTWEHDGLAPVTQTERRTDAGADTDDDTDARFFAIVSDLVGTPTELVDEDGRIAWSGHRTLWGLTAWPAGSSAHTPLRFPGQYHDPESGLHYNYHRYYDPETARYLSQDPLGLDPAPNPHTYVRNPLEQTDPLGLGPYTILYHGSMNWQGTEFALDLSQTAKRPGTPEAGVYMTDDFTRAATGYGRGGHVVRIKVPEEFAASIRQMGGPNGNQPEFFVNTPEGLAIVNEGITEILPTMEAIGRNFAGTF